MKGENRNLALKAKKEVFKLCSKADIRIVNPKRDKYFRILADQLFCGDVNVGEYLLKNNLAVTYDGKTKSNYENTR